MKESDLYLPLKRFLESKNYDVKGEIQNCDVMAVRDNEPPVIIELKLSLNLSVILQAVERLSLSSTVYIGVPAQVKALSGRQKKSIIKLLRMLGMGLIAIDVDANYGSVVVLQDPGEYRPRQSKVRQKRLLGEFMKRQGDPNLGGSQKRHGLMTVYRQRALKIASYLQSQGPTKAAHIAKALSEPKTRDVLYNNVYGWFDRLSLGVYQLSARGAKEIEHWRASTK